MLVIMIERFRAEKAGFLKDLWGSWPSSALMSGTPRSNAPGGSVD